MTNSVSSTRLVSSNRADLATIVMLLTRYRVWRTRREVSIELKTEDSLGAEKRRRMAEKLTRKPTAEREPGKGT